MSNLATEFTPKGKYLIYNVEGNFDYGIGHFIIDKVFYCDEEGDLVYFENEILTGFINDNHEAITDQVMKENDIFQNDGYLTRRY